ncbi:MAG: response regulator [Nitrospirae bacterium]|nr:response regulator [Nitrospirota bacterium]
MNNGKKGRVLIVEDDRDEQELMRRFLARDFAEVYTASNGCEGLELFRQHRPGVVVTDIQMPEMDGLEMIERIAGEAPSQPIIVATGYDDDEHKSDKAWHTFVKPISYRDLSKAVAACLEKSGHS